jgi:hypothetical protein
VKALLCTLRRKIPPNLEEYLVIYTYLSQLNIHLILYGFKIPWVGDIPKMQTGFG